MTEFSKAGRSVPFAHRRRLANTTLHVAGISLSFVSVGMMLCAVLELATTDRDTAALVVGALFTGTAGGLLWYFTRVGQTRSRNIFAAVGWTWLLITIFGAAPYLFAGTFAIAGADVSEQLVNALFESASGFSCTGSTVLDDFLRPGRGMLMYRQATQWYGGMGVVLLAVAILPFLGVGGLDLIAAEAPGPSGDRLTPRVSETAKRLWIVYLGFTVAIALALWVVPGPTLYDGVAHGLSTAATGGFSTYGDSIGHFDSVAVEVVLIVAMFFGGANFALHYAFLTGRRRAHLDDAEFHGYVWMIIVASSLIISMLWIRGGFDLTTAIRSGTFNTVSLATSTGFGNAQGAGSAGDFVTWIAGPQMVLLLMMAIGGCTGSTAGGLKVMRLQVLSGYALREMRRSQSPRAAMPVRLGHRAVSEDIVARVAGFVLLHSVILIAGVLIITSLGGDLETTIGAVLGSLGNMGPALNEGGPTVTFNGIFSEPARLLIAALMLIGRLEILPVLLMFAAPFRAVDGGRPLRLYRARRLRSAKAQQTRKSP